jgi:hypothetical protein
MRLAIKIYNIRLTTDDTLLSAVSTIAALGAPAMQLTEMPTRVILHGSSTALIEHEPFVIKLFINSNHRQAYMAGKAGIEPAPSKLTVWWTTIIPLASVMAGRPGIEPGTTRFGVSSEPSSRPVALGGEIESPASCFSSKRSTD